jgi:hypothetical protein
MKAMSFQSALDTIETLEVKLTEFAKKVSLHYSSVEKVSTVCTLAGLLSSTCSGRTVTHAFAIVPQFTHDNAS